MKKFRTFLTATFAITVSLLGASSKVEPGHSYEEVVCILGKPIGTLALGNKTILMYPKGDITLRENRVSDINLISDEEFTAEQERKRLEREEWSLRQEKISAARLEKGEKLKAKKLQSSAFIALPAKQRVDYWRAFQVHYPEVDVTEQIVRALEVYQAELAERMTLQRIAELEARVTRTEQALAAAQNENEHLRSQLSRQSLNFSNQYTYETRPYRIHYPQRTVIVRPNKTSCKRHPDPCPDSSRHDLQEQFCQATESTAERASRVLSSVRQ